MTKLAMHTNIPWIKNQKKKKLELLKNEHIKLKKGKHEHETKCMKRICTWSKCLSTFEILFLKDWTN